MIGHPRCDWQGFYHQHKGGAIPVFRGIDYQRGHGVFTNALKRIFLPVGRVLWSMGKDWVKDVAVEGQNPKQALKRRALATAQTLTNEGFERLRKKIDQSGSGRPRIRISSAAPKRKRKKRVTTVVPALAPITRPRKGKKKKKKAAKKKKAPPKGGRKRATSSTRRKAASKRKGTTARKRGRATFPRFGPLFPTTDLFNR